MIDKPNLSGCLHNRSATNSVNVLSVTSESMCTKYWLTACSSMPRKKVWLVKLTVPP